jgi:hypothetical protein
MNYAPWEHIFLDLAAATCVRKREEEGIDASVSPTRLYNFYAAMLFSTMQYKLAKVLNDLSGATSEKYARYLDTI